MSADDLKEGGKGVTKITNDENIVNNDLNGGNNNADLKSAMSSKKHKSKRKYKKQVAFDTFQNSDAPLYSLTLKAKHKEYVFCRTSRTFLVGIDDNAHSEFALEWLLEELTDDGDEIVCFRVVDPSSPLSTGEKRLYRDEAYDSLEAVMEKNVDDKKISVVFELVVGKIENMIQNMIQIYEPVMLVVGTRGKSSNGIHGLRPRSVSKYCLQHSPVPVIVVHPDLKRYKNKKKSYRVAEKDGRKNYFDILEQDSDKLKAQAPLETGELKNVENVTSEPIKIDTTTKEVPKVDILNTEVPKVDIVDTEVPKVDIVNTEVSKNDKHMPISTDISTKSNDKNLEDVSPKSKPTEAKTSVTTSSLEKPVGFLSARRHSSHDSSTTFPYGSLSSTSPTVSKPKASSFSSKRPNTLLILNDSVNNDSNEKESSHSTQDTTTPPHSATLAGLSRSISNISITSSSKGSEKRGKSASPSTSKYRKGLLL